MLKLKLKLDTIMDKKGINTNQLSEMTGIRWNTIKDMEENKARHWSPANLEKIMKALKIDDIQELIEYSEE